MSEKKTDAAAAAVQSTATLETAAQTAETAARNAAPAEIPKAYADYAELAAVVAAPLGLNLRKGPAVSYGVMETLFAGTPVTVLPLPYGVEVKGWALVVSESGTRGWVMTEFLSELPAGE